MKPEPPTSRDPQHPLPEPGTYSVAQAAARLGIGTSTAYDLLARGEFPVPVARIGRTFKIKRAVLEAWLAGDPHEAA